MLIYPTEPSVAAPIQSHCSKDKCENHCQRQAVPGSYRTQTGMGINEPACQPVEILSKSSIWYKVREALLLDC